MVSRERAVLVLEDGKEYFGQSYARQGVACGELVFATGMTGYQETLTDPSYAGQIVMQTFPHIGNTGVNSADNESDQVWVSGYIVRDPSRITSNYRAEDSLESLLIQNEIVGISDVDTRAITRHIRSQGAMRAGIFSGEFLANSAQERLDIVKNSQGMIGRNLSGEVSTKQPYVIKAKNTSVGNLAVLDLGVKRSTLDYLAKSGFDVHVFPQSSTMDEILAVNPVGVFYSNGPGDPAASDQQVELLREVLGSGLPYFGICFGNQLFGRAIGLDTYKLPFGHRGINQPVLDKSTGKVQITSQNHGFAIKAELEGIYESPLGFGKFEVSHYSLNDQVVEGLRALDIPAFSVQYHPEAAAGPHDSVFLFEEFKSMVLEHQIRKGEGK
ncbi:MAG: glutamine-hydrolyzing carbamoyl-phosphate synthase small subunit [Microbacteriaceae bacterium]|nr:glutamine-hydrolyzing carbamoyl-phosphate synthase small subunit [Microbacteriaceae bacterium]